MFALPFYWDLTVGPNLIYSTADTLGGSDTVVPVDVYRFHL